MEDHTNQPQSDSASESSPKREVGDAVTGPSPDNPALTHVVIARRAYEIYESTGHRPGRCLDNWEQAERELRQERAKQQAHARRSGSTDEDEGWPAVRPFPQATRNGRSRRGISPQGPGGNNYSDG